MKVIEWFTQGKRLEVLTLIVLVIGWLGNYFLVQRYAARVSEAKFSKETALLISELQPKVSANINGFMYRDGRAEIFYNIENAGIHSVTISRQKSEFWPDNRLEDQYIDGKNYEISHPRTFSLPPGQKITHAIYVNFISGQKPKASFYSKILFKYQTNPTVVNIYAKQLKAHVSDEQLSELSTFYQGQEGYIGISYATSPNEPQIVIQIDGKQIKSGIQNGAKYIGGTIHIANNGGALATLILENGPLMVTPVTFSDGNGIKLGDTRRYGIFGDVTLKQPYLTSYSIHGGNRKSFPYLVLVESAGIYYVDFRIQQPGHNYTQTWSGSTYVVVK